MMIDDHTHNDGGQTIFFKYFGLFYALEGVFRALACSYKSLKVLSVTCTSFSGLQLTICFEKTREEDILLLDCRI